MNDREDKYCEHDQFSETVQDVHHAEINCLEADYQNLEGYKIDRFVNVKVRNP